mgnify:CR=1 FL=1
MFHLFKTKRFSSITSGSCSSSYSITRSSSSSCSISSSVFLLLLPQFLYQFHRLCLAQILHHFFFLLFNFCINCFVLFFFLLNFCFCFLFLLNSVDFVLRWYKKIPFFSSLRFCFIQHQLFLLLFACSKIECESVFAVSYVLQFV